MNELSEKDLYGRLLRYVVSPMRLKLLGYPEEDLSFNESVSILQTSGDFLNKLRRKKPFTSLTLRNGFKSNYLCKRCEKVYKVDVCTGLPLAESGICLYHPGRVLRYELNNQYDCCLRRAYSVGCTSNKYHVHREVSDELTTYTGYVKTQPRGQPDGCKIFALDCEMCYTTIGLELVSLTLLNYKKQVVYETLCKPLNPILDYNTRFSGLEEGDLDEVEKTLVDVQRDLLEIISAESILVGHGLDSDLTELKMFHYNIIDTVALFPHPRGLPYKKGLKNLVKTYLGQDIQNSSSHDSCEDAKAAFDLAMYHVLKRRI